MTIYNDLELISTIGYLMVLKIGRIMMIPIMSTTQVTELNSMWQKHLKKGEAPPTPEVVILI